MGKKKKQTGGKTSDSDSNQNKSEESSSKMFNEDAAVFINMAQELKMDGNQLFQKRDPEGALLKYEKALKLLPKNHVDVAYIRSHMAACYMDIGPGEWRKAIEECNLALDISPKYGKALLKRARCYEYLNRLDLALQDVSLLLKSEPNNATALEIAERVREKLEKKGLKADNRGIILAPEYDELPCPSPKTVKRKLRKKKSSKMEDKVVVEEHHNDKLAVEEHQNDTEEATRTVKLVFGEDIRWAQIPTNCSISQLREIVWNRFPGLKAILIKYKDQEGDLVTITSTEELRLAEASADPQGSVRLYVVGVCPGKDPLFFEEAKNGGETRRADMIPSNVPENGRTKRGGENRSFCIDDWIVRFAQLFRNHVGINSDGYLDLHELGMKVYSEALEEVVTSEEAQGLLEDAAGKFQEMMAVALFNWGNVHMSQARKRMILTEDASSDSVIEQVRSAYAWSKRENKKAGEKYKEALKIKHDFYEGFLALGQQQFERAKLSWCFAMGNKVDLKTWPSSIVINLFTHAEENIVRGAEIWEQVEAKGLNRLSRIDKEKEVLQKVGLDGHSKDSSADETAEQATNMMSQINLLWGTMLYERSTIEFKLGMESWKNHVEAATKKFKLAGISQTDIAAMRKNHCSNVPTDLGLGFDTDEIVQAWNEMYDAKRCLSGFQSFRLEPLLQRQVPKLHRILEHA
ncbi:protein PHOX1-like [Magnolia sinica]|uniref:protein PHOX1-like n=1 Tax=Magnolia sinica TaxID=86752 RepID=UPI00265B08D8|nr:protein PHOX1-like [Magnolia sinica]XP_058067427.1 protein PHOX1-like [Magnolia sinica]XP_058067428.1 protein PHOX1-like [Magnolia sinica]XP_058067429.1 protein PHOX1-like [Magnolia sinica]